MGSSGLQGATRQRERPKEVPRGRKATLGPPGVGLCPLSWAQGRISGLQGRTRPNTRGRVAAEKGARPGARAHLGEGQLGGQGEAFFGQKLLLVLRQHQLLAVLGRRPGQVRGPRVMLLLWGRGGRGTRLWGQGNRLPEANETPDLGPYGRVCRGAPAGPGAAESEHQPPEPALPHPGTQWAKQRPAAAQVTISRFAGSSPASGSQAGSPEPACESLSPSAPLHCPLSLSLS